MTANRDPLQTHSSLSVGGRVILVIRLALIPVFGFFAYWIDDRRQNAHEAAEASVRRMVERSASRHEMFYTIVRQTLELLARPDALAFGLSGNCPDRLVEISKHQDWLRDAWIVDSDGNVLCATGLTTPAPRLEAEDNERIKQANFSVIGLRSDADGDAFHLVAARSVQRSATTSRSIILARIDVAALTSSTTVPGSSKDIVTMSLDYKHQVITHNGVAEAGLIGTSLRDHPTINQLANSSNEPIVGSIGDDVERILISKRIPELDLMIVAGLDRSSAVAASQRDMIVGAGILMVVILLTTGIGWIVARRLILDPVLKVRDTALSMAGGNLGSRVALDRGPREIREMARAFDSMADRLEGMALNDQLTGAPNRRHFDTYASRLVSDARPFAVLAIDLDGFKPINDRFGHAAGDDILRLIADRLSQNIDEREFFARIGGDEFVAIQLASDSDGQDLQAVELGRRILKAISAPTTIGDSSLELSGSIGLASWPADGESLDELMDNADRALYAAKASGRNQIVVFDGSQPDTSPKKRRSPAQSTAA